MDELILCHIETKIQGHRKNDRLKFPLQENTDFVTPTWVYDQLMENSNCRLCFKEMQLHSWKYLSPDQFTLDRLDDTIGHLKSNIQIVCFGCNQQKAYDQYGISAEVTHLLPEYNTLVAYYKKNTNYMKIECRVVYLQKIYDLHEQIFTKKPNRWGKALAAMTALNNAHKSANNVRTFINSCSN